MALQLTCKTCDLSKSVDLFYRRPSSKRGYRGDCKACMAVKQQERMENPSIKERKQKADKLWRENNKDKKKFSDRAYYESHKAIHNEGSREYYHTHKKELAVYRSSYYQENKEAQYNRVVAYRSTPKGRAIKLESESRRRATKLNATPSWYTNDDSQYIKDIYQGCREFENILTTIGLDVSFHVDHIIPLQGELVCGLHHPNNLQILPAKENLAKGNSFKEELIWH